MLRSPGFANLLKIIPAKAGTRERPGPATDSPDSHNAMDTHPSPRVTTPVISVAGLSKRYGRSDQPAIDDLAFAINEGETLAILGPSGCGKTTMLRLLMGFEAPDSGEIRVRDRVVAAPGQWVPPEKRGLGMIFQQFALFPHLTTEQNVGYGLMKMRGDQKERRVSEVLDLVGMSEFAGRYPHQLSGGQQQRVALARALAPEPLVILMDEPFSNLDSGMRAEMRREVKAILSKLGATTILVTHYQGEAFSLADRILILREGRLEQLNTPDNIYHRPASRFVAGFVGLADFIPVRLHDGHVETELGSFPFDGVPPEGDLDLLIRPDDIDLAADAGGHGEIVEREFKGSENLYRVRLPSGRSVRSTQPSLAVFHIGQRVTVQAHPDHVVLFSRDEHDR